MSYAMAEFVHPHPQDVPLTAVLHALADPARLAIVRNLARAGEMKCSAALPGEDIAKSTRSNHFKVLRMAGLVRTRKSGREYLSTLRRDDVEQVYPGVLESVLQQLD